jgi:hypothetical protein
VRNDVDGVRLRGQVVCKDLLRLPGFGTSREVRWQRWCRGGEAVELLVMAFRFRTEARDEAGPDVVRASGDDACSPAPRGVVRRASQLVLGDLV